MTGAETSTDGSGLFEFDVTAVRHSLEENGYAVVENVLNAAECQQGIDKMWSWLEKLGTGIFKHKPATWNESAWPPNIHGIIHHLPGHQDFVWSIRKHPNVLRVFKELWGDDDLLVSFDGISIRRAHTPGKIGDLHRDQNPYKPDFLCVQGIVNLTRITPEHASLVVRRGSHKFDARQLSRAPQHETDMTRDFIKVTEEDLPKVECYEAVRLVGGVGSLFLFDSRTLHQGVPATNENLWRYAVYVCYQPRYMATEEELLAKQKAYEEYRQTTHWPLASKVKPERHVSQFKFVKTRDTVEDEVVRRLSGF